MMYGIAHLIIVRKGPKTTPLPILRNVDNYNFPQMYFIRPRPPLPPFSLLQVGTQE